MSANRLWLLVQLLGTVALLVLLGRDFDWSSFGALVQLVSPWFYLWSLALLVLGQLLYAVKWWAVLKGMSIRLPLGRVTEQYFISLFFGNFLPTSVGGDVARVYGLGRTSGYLAIGGSVVIDRALSLFWISVLAVALTWALQVESPEFRVARDLLTAFLLLGIVALVTLLVVPVRRLSLRALGIAWLPERFGQRVRALIVQMRGAARKPSVLLWTLVVVSAYYGLLAVVYHHFFYLTMGERVAVWPVVAGLLGVAVLSNLPITLNGIGLREHLHFVIFATVGVPKEAAVAVSLLVFSQLLLVSLAGYVLWMRAPAMSKLRSPAANVDVPRGGRVDAQSLSR